MRTSEVQDLIEWLRSLPNPAAPSIYFTEPLYAFSYDPAEPWIVSATLRGEAVPSRLPEYEARWNEGVRLWLVTSARQLEEFAEMLAEDLSRTPPR